MANMTRSDICDEREHETHYTANGHITTYTKNGGWYWTLINEGNDFYGSAESRKEALRDAHRLDNELISSDEDYGL